MPKLPTLRKPKAKRQAQEQGNDGNIKGIVGRAVLVAVALVACALPPIFVNDAIGYIPLIALVVVLVLSYVYLRLLRRALAYSEESLIPSCERGTEIEFVLNFENSSPLLFVRLEPYIYISDLFDNVDTITPVSMPLMPFEKRDFRFQARFDHIGTYAAGIKKIVIHDLLGLFTYTIHNPNRHRVEVLPRIVDMESLPLTSTASAESRKPLQTLVTDDMDYAGVREYRYGDPMKAVHWKLSARMEEGTLLTRIYETYGNTGITTIVDPYAPDCDAEKLMHVFDGIVEAALSTEEYARAMGLDVELAYVNRDGEIVKTQGAGLADTERLMDDMLQVTVPAAGQGGSALECLRREENSIHGQGNIAFVTSRTSEELVTLLVDAKLKKRNPLLFVVVPPSTEPDERAALLRPLERLARAQINVYVVEPTEHDTKVVAR